MDLSNARDKKGGPSSRSFAMNANGSPLSTKSTDPSPSKRKWNSSFKPSNGFEPIGQGAAFRDNGMNEDDEDEMNSTIKRSGDLTKRRTAATPNAEEKEKRNEMETTDNSGCFNELLSQLANMNIPDKDEQECIVCFRPIKSDMFETHVITCLDKMESNMKHFQSRSFCPSVQDERNMFAGGDCPLGVDCKQNNSHHFIFMRHPKVDCPICQEDFHMYEINAHITFCLDKGDAPAGEGIMMQDEKSEAKQPSMMPGSPQGGHGSMGNGMQGGHGSMGNGMQGGHGSMGNGMQGASGNGIGSPSKLTPQQMSSMARMVLKAQQESGASNGSQDQSLVQMLSRFKSLGFTKENIRKTLAGGGLSLPTPMLNLQSSGSSSGGGDMIFSLKQPTFKYDGVSTFGEASPFNDSKTEIPVPRNSESKQVAQTDGAMVALPDDGDDDL